MLSVLRFVPAKVGTSKAAARRNCGSCLQKLVPHTQLHAEACPRQDRHTTLLPLLVCGGVVAVRMQATINELFRPICYTKYHSQAPFSMVSHLIGQPAAHACVSERRKPLLSVLRFVPAKVGTSKAAARRALRLVPAKVGTSHAAARRSMSRQIGTQQCCLLVCGRVVAV